MTAAATDGRTSESARVTLAVLVSAREHEPGDPGEQRGDDVQHDQDLPRPGAGQPGRDRVVADREQQAAIAGPPQDQQDQERDRDEHDQAVGDHVERAARPERPQDRPARRRRSGPICSCHTFASPSTIRLMPSVMISGWTRNTPTPMPVDQAGERGGDQRDGDRPRRAARAVDERRRRRTRPSTRRRRPTGRCRRSAS